MKYLIILFLFLNLPLIAQEFQVKGRVLDGYENSPLAEANIFIENSNTGAITDENGNFILEGNFSKNSFAVISFVGYQQKKIKISDLQNNNSVKLYPEVLTSQTVLVTGSIGKEGETPAAFSKITQKHIEENYTVQDIPEYLSTLPSSTFYSQSGSGIGYNFLSIRGFDQRRISVSINGIPQNDPEDHNVYWLDFPDILASTELIQVQRGAGSGVIGYPAIGGSINIITSPFSEKQKFEINSSYGNFNTRKFSGTYASGLINNKYSIYAKYSKLLSSGYRNNAWVDFNSYHFSAVRYDKNLTSQINVFGGLIFDGLDYTGVPKSILQNKELRKNNSSYWYYYDNELYFYERRPEEKEKFSQPHFEILNEYKINENLNLNSALFMILGNGYFDYDASWADTSYFRLTNQYGFNLNDNPVNSIIRAKVENKQYGWIPRLSYDYGFGELLLGSELRIHRSLHWGKINYAENLPANFDLDYKYYEYKGGKNIINSFVHNNFNFGNINILAEIQAAYHKYKLYDEKFLGNDFSISNLFWNFRSGFNYKFNQNVNSYFSFARVSREPRLSNYYDAGESAGGEIPQFEKLENGNYDFGNPLVKPETMNDFEFGTYFRTANFNLGANLFYMIFNDEIVKNGKVDRFGDPITGNAEKTIHSGIEFTSNFKLTKNFDFLLNATYSKNFIEKGKTFIEYEDQISGENRIAEIDLSKNKISGFPEILVNGSVKFQFENLLTMLTARYSGEFYSDNFDENLNELLQIYPGFTDYQDNKVDAYFTADLFASYVFKLNSNLKTIKIFGEVNNLFDELYAAYAIGGEFFPAAERNFLIGIQFGF